MSLILEALARPNTSASPGLHQAAPGKPRGAAPTKQGWSTFYILLSVAVLAGMATMLGWLVSQRNAATPTPIQASSASEESGSWHNPQPSTLLRTPAQQPATGRQAQTLRDTSPPADIPTPLLKMAKHIQEQEELIRKLETRLSSIADEDRHPYMQTAVFADPDHQQTSTVPNLPQGSFVVQEKATKTPDAEMDEQIHENKIAERMQTFESAMARADWTAAQKHLNELTNLLPADSLTLLRNNAWLLMNKGDDAQSMKLYTRILARLPNDLNAQLNIAILDQRMGNRSAAAKRLQRILDENPGQPDALAALDYLQALP